MRLADEMLLAQIRERLLSHIPDDQWKLVEQEVDKAGGVREVGGYTGVLLTDAMSKASFGGDRSAAGRYAAEQRWKGHQKGGTNPQSSKRPTMEQRRSQAARSNRKKNKENMARIQEERGLNRFGEPRKRGKDIDDLSAADQKEYADRMSAARTSEERRAIAQEFKDRAKYPGVTTVVSDETFANLPKLPERTPEQQARIEANVRAILAERDQKREREAGALRGLKDTPTYKLNVETSKAEMKRGDDGVARFRGSDLKALREKLKTEEDVLEGFESGKIRSRQIFGGGPLSRNNTETRAILQARVASARANVQAMEEFEDETSPGYLSS